MGSDGGKEPINARGTRAALHVAEADAAANFERRDLCRTDCGCVQGVVVYLRQLDRFRSTPWGAMLSSPGRKHVFRETCPRLGGEGMAPNAVSEVRACRTRSFGRLGSL